MTAPIDHRLFTDVPRASRRAAVRIRRQRRRAAIVAALQGAEGTTGLAMVVVSCGMVAMVALRTAAHALGW